MVEKGFEPEKGYDGEKAAGYDPPIERSLEGEGNWKELELGNSRGKKGSRNERGERRGGSKGRRKKEQGRRYEAV